MGLLSLEPNRAELGYLQPSGESRVAKPTVRVKRGPEYSVLTPYGLVAHGDLRSTFFRLAPLRHSTSQFNLNPIVLRGCVQRTTNSEFVSTRDVRTEATIITETSLAAPQEPGDMRSLDTRSIKLQYPPLSGIFLRIFQFTALRSRPRQTLGISWFEAGPWTCPSCTGQGGKCRW